MKLAVVTFLYQSYRKHIYNADHVRALSNMIKANLTLPHDFVCITDQKVEGVNTYPMWDFPDMRPRPGDPDNWRALKIFGIAKDLGDRLLVLDLDILIRRNINHLITDDPFRVAKGKAAPYGSCIYLFDTDKYGYIWDTFEPEAAKRIIAEKRHPDGRKWVGTDQAWISHCVPDAALYTPEDGVYRYRNIMGRPLPEDSCVINWAGNVKPWHRNPHSEWTYHEYMGYLN